MPRILILEDNPKLSDLLSRFLKKRGFETDVVADGINAVRAFVGAAYDVIIADRELPFMNGAEVCKRIRQSQKGAATPIIMLSMMPREQTEIDGLVQELRLTAFLVKPFSAEELHSLIRSSLDRSSLETEPAVSSGATAEQTNETNEMKGSLELVPFEKVLLHVVRRRSSGTLSLTRDEGSRKFFILLGEPAIAETTLGKDDFGSHLLRRKLVDEVELREYQERWKRSGDEDRTLFVKMGCLTPDQFREENANFLLEKIVDCFCWRTGRIVFEPTPFSGSGFSAPTASAPLLFYRGFKTHLRVDALNAFLEGRGSFYTDRSSEFYDYQNHLAPVVEAPEMLDFIDGSKTIAELTNLVDADDAAVVLYTLDYLKSINFSEHPEKAGIAPSFPIREQAAHQPIKEAETFEDLGGELRALADEVGSIEAIKPFAVPTAKASGAASELLALEEDLKNQWESIKDKNYYEMFGLTQKNFSMDKLKKAYFSLTKTYGPEKFFASSSEVMVLAEELLSKVSNAYETLTNVVSKENYDELLSSQEQGPSREEDKEFYEQIQFQSGKVFIEQGQYDSAEKAFTNCLNIDSKKSEYLAFLALAVYNNPGNRGNPAALKRARDLVNKSLQYGKLSIAYALKGTMYLDEGGNLTFAEAEFNKALKLNPSNKTALKKLEILKQKREEEKKGLFQRMFR